MSNMGNASAFSKKYFFPKIELDSWLSLNSLFVVICEDIIRKCNKSRVCLSITQRDSAGQRVCDCAYAFSLIEWHNGYVSGMFMICKHYGPLSLYTE